MAGAGKYQVKLQKYKCIMLHPSKLPNFAGGSQYKIK